MENQIIQEIKPGVTLHFIPVKRFKTVNLSVNITRPLDAAEVTKNALFPAVLRRGCAKYPLTQELNIYLEELYGASFSYGIKKKGDCQIISLHFKTVADKYTNGQNPFEKLLDLAREVLFCPVVKGNGFDPEFTAREKENLKLYIESMINDKRTYTRQRMIEEMCKGEAYSIFEYGRIEDLDQITPENLYAHYVSIITTSPMDIFITGDTDTQAATEKIAGFFAGNQVPVAPYPKTQLGKAPEQINYASQAEPVTQGKLSMGFRTSINRTHPLFYAMMVCNNLYGGSPHSKLFLNVREKLSLAYYASAAYDSYKGLVMVNCGIEFDRYDVTVKEVFAQLDDMKQGNFTEEEIGFSRLAICNAFQGMKDNADAMEDFYAGQFLSGTGDSIDDVIEKVQAVTKEQMVEAANTIQADTVFFLKGEETK